MCWSECSKIGCNVGAVGAINSQFTGFGKHDANKVKLNYLSHGKTQEGSAERTVACESLVIPVVQLLQTWGLWHWNFGHFTEIEMMPYAAVQVCYNCHDISVCFRA